MKTWRAYSAVWSIPTTVEPCQTWNVLVRSYSAVSVSWTGLWPAASCLRQARERDSRLRAW